MREEARAERTMSEVVDNPSKKRFEMAVGDVLAVAYYRLEGGRVVLLHTEVPRELSGRGVGSKLARGVFEALRERGARVVAKCEFMAAYVARHPEYAAMLEG
jgi:predicted GNAT family acetyltransferase